MSEGNVLAAGRDAELIDLGGGRVLRRPRDGRPLDAEAAVMRAARVAGYPVPEVHDARPDGLVMERVDGPTMLDDLGSRPWRVDRHARTLAELHRRLHRIPAGAGMRSPFGETPDGMLVHGDLHPGNVLLAARGPVVIDWSNAGRGPAGADVADAWLLLAAARPPAGPLLRLLVAALRRRFLAEFLRHAGREEAARHLRAAAERRMADPHMDPAELAAMRELARTHGR
jgi:aminoglycoside phosphotransferase (APT) family kinase protein